MSWNDFVDSLKDEVVATPASLDRKPAKTYPCGQCAGTGVWTGGYVQRVTGKCHACRGKGYFVSSPEARNRSKAKRQEASATKAAALAASIAEFKVAHPQMYEALMDAQLGGNVFLNSLASQLTSYGRLSEKQIAAYYRGIEARAKAISDREANAPKVDLTAVEALFSQVMERGLKKPSYRAEGFVITPASATGVNAGALYLKDEAGAYMGKMRDGKVFLINVFQSSLGEVVHTLQRIAQDPKGTAIAYGRKTGVCCCCGRQLTDEASIAAGIGPICEGRWF